MSKTEQLADFELGDEAQQAVFMLDSMGLGIKGNPGANHIYAVWNIKTKHWVCYYDTPGPAKARVTYMGGRNYVVVELAVAYTPSRIIRKKENGKWEK